MNSEPYLPGFLIQFQRENHHRDQQFILRNGYNIPKVNHDEISSINVLSTKPVDHEIIKFQPSYIRKPLLKTKCDDFEPHFVKFDGKCLFFEGYFRQELSEFNENRQLFRKINIIYYLEDDTITIFEPPVPNAGYPQGKLVRRGRIPKVDTRSYWYWKDLNVGIDIEMYGITYHISSCDLFTKEFLLSQGIEVNENEDIPQYSNVKTYTKSTCNNNIEFTTSQDKLYRFLQFDKKVLRFYALWENEENGDLVRYKIHYYLIDDTVEVMEIDNKCEPFNRFLCRIKLPKTSEGNAFQSNVSVPCVLSTRDFYEPKDFQIGSTISVLNRKFLIYDCDEFTRRYYRECLKYDQPEAIRVNMEEPKLKAKMEIPPHTGIGCPEDTIQSCMKIVPQPPKKDIIHYVENVNKVLRYTAELESTIETDKDRQFIIQYSLADGKISIFERKIANSGFQSGYFLKSTLIPKVGSSGAQPEYYSPADFMIGNTVPIFGRNFLITGADLAVFRYMEQRPQKFSQEVTEAVKHYLQRQGIIASDGNEVDTQIAIQDK